jgi:hypothetical protein
VTSNPPEPVSGTQAIVAVIEQLAKERENFTSDDIRPLLPAGADIAQIPSAVGQARREGIVREVGRVKSKIPERKASLVPIFAAGPALRKKAEAGRLTVVGGVSEEIDELRAYLERRGHLISVDELTSLLLLIASRGWTILAGPSGTGKSRIIRLLAEAFESPLIDVQVKRNWTGSDEVLGYYSETARQWVPGPLYSALIDAENTSALCFVRFDEMNLAPPEYYVAELLSAGESWELQGGKLVSAAIQLQPSPKENAPKPPRLTNSVLLFGTLNVDETTQPLSPKMLDRSSVVTFENVDLASLPHFGQRGDPPRLPGLKALLLNRPRDLLMLGGRLDATLFTTLIPLFSSIDAYTTPLGYPVGYRQRDGLLILLSLWKEAGVGNVLTFDGVVDAGVRSMILPKLQGSALGMGQYLRGLAGILAGADRPLDDAVDALRDRLAIAKYPRSLEKVISMIEQLSVLGYFGYW